jgi:hypothetical protein
VVEPENPGVEMTPVEEAKTVEAEEPLPQIAEPEKRSLDDGRFVVETAEPVLEFQRKVADSKRRPDCVKSVVSR